MHNYIKNKVSVCVVTYNHEKYIQQCLKSIVDQETDFDFDVFVGDDCSTDCTRQTLLAFAKKYPKKVNLILHDKNIGGQHNFASVIAVCRGKYTAYIDGDDLMSPGKLQKQVDFLDSHPDCSIVCHDLRVFDDLSGETLYYFNDNYKKEISTINDLIKYGTFFGHSSKMYRTSAVPEEGVDLSHACIGDWLYHIQNARKGKIGYIDEVLGEYRKHTNSASSHNTQKIALALTDSEYILNKASEYVLDQEVVRYGFARIYSSYAWNYFEAQDFKEFKKLIKKSAENGIFIDDNHKRLFKFRNFPRFLFAIRKIKNHLTTRNA